MVAVLDWLVSEKHYRVSAELLELADVAMQVNLALDSLQADPKVEKDLRALLV